MGRSAQARVSPQRKLQLEANREGRPAKTAVGGDAASATSFPVRVPNSTLFDEQAQRSYFSNAKRERARAPRLQSPPAADFAGRVDRFASSCTFRWMGAPASGAKPVHTVGENAPRTSAGARAPRAPAFHARLCWHVTYSHLPCWRGAWHRRQSLRCSPQQPAPTLRASMASHRPWREWKRMAQSGPKERPVDRA